jgi:hypothetical protein
MNYPANSELLKSNINQFIRHSLLFLFTVYLPITIYQNLFTTYITKQFEVPA